MTHFCLKYESNISFIFESFFFLQPPAVMIILYMKLIFMINKIQKK